MGGGKLKVRGVARFRMAFRFLGISFREAKSLFLMPVNALAREGGSQNHVF